MMKAPRRGRSLALLVIADSPIDEIGAIRFVEEYLFSFGTPTDDMVHNIGRI